ncbi:MAG: helix-turn-helix transcriptional regulator, partial [Pricia sp.]
KAVHCYIDLLGTAKSMDVQLSAGIHIKEGAVAEAHFVSEATEWFLESILNQAEPGQILITQTVKYLLSGAGLNFTENKSVFELTSGEPILLYGVTDDSRLDDQTSFDPQELPKYDSILENVLQCIDVHLDDEIFGVEVLCKEIGVSERQLQRKLKAITNKSPIQLISSVRLHRAKELLLQHQDNISEIAYQTGFSNPSYFSKSFKKEFGLSPSAIRPKPV